MCGRFLLSDSDAGPRRFVEGLAGSLRWKQENASRRSMVQMCTCILPESPIGAGLVTETQGHAVGVARLGVFLSDRPPAASTSVAWGHQAGRVVVDGEAGLPVWSPGILQLMT